MCDDQTQFDADQDAINRGISRRDLAKLTSAAALASVLPVPANAADVVEQDVIIPTPDGEADCYFVHPAEGAHAGVLMWPDILSLRPAARRKKVVDTAPGHTDGRTRNATAKE